MSQDDAPPPANILVVDDTIENVRLLASMLAQHGFEIRPVTSGRQALEAVQGDPPDLVLLDITMPEMSGFEVCARLKQQPELRDVPVIFLTALTDVQDKVKAFGLGGVDYITKPFQVEEVLARVKTHVALRQARAALARSHEELRGLEQLRDDLVHMIVHDLRSPLTTIMGMIDLVRVTAGPALGDKQRHYLDGALQGAQAVADLANDLLDVRRLEEQRLTLERCRCDLTALAGTVRDSIGAWEKERAIEVVAAGPVEAECDARLVRRVLENLVGNAVKHTPQGSQVRVHVTRRDGQVRVAIEDQGPGVKPEDQARIFEKFGTGARQVRRYHSAGLGLAFCRLVVEAHGGQIGVEAGATCGSVFWLHLPG